MPRKARVAPGGLIYHVLNRGVGRRELFHKAADYDAFLKVVVEAHQRHPVRLLAFCLMPNHWHLLLWPREEGDLSRHLHWLTVTHVQRYHAHHHTSGTGHLYQGRFKAFPIQEDAHFLTVGRYVECNAWRAGLVDSPGDWRWGSLWQRHNGRAEVREILSPWPVPMPRGWTRVVGRPQDEEKLVAVRRSVSRGSPYGDESWRNETAEALGLAFTLRDRGRPGGNL